MEHGAKDNFLELSVMRIFRAKRDLLTGDWIKFVRILTNSTRLQILLRLLNKDNGMDRELAVVRRGEPSKSHYIAEILKQNVNYKRTNVFNGIQHVILQ